MIPMTHRFCAKRGRQVWRVCLITLLFCKGLICMDYAQSEALTGGGQPALENPQALHTITGTLAVLDVSTGKGMLKTDLDKPIFFTVVRPDMFERLSIGDRVTVQLDDDGRAVKVIETLPAELHQAPPPAR